MNIKKLKSNIWQILTVTIESRSDGSLCDEDVDEKLKEWWGWEPFSINHANGKWYVTLKSKLSTSNKYQLLQDIEIQQLKEENAKLIGRRKWWHLWNFWSKTS